MTEYHDRRDCPEPAAPHTCPFATEIGEDPDFRCTCCQECTDECWDDI